MHNPLLETFIVVSECKSFNKASKKLYISVPTIKYQIDQLENHLGIILFDRTSNGLVLTEKGKVLLIEAKKIISLSNNILNKIRDDNNEEKDVIKFGISMLNDAHDFRKIWPVINKDLHYKLRFIQLSDDKDEIPKQVGYLDSKIDLLYGIYDARILSNYNFLKTGICKPILIVPKSHRLARYKIVKLENLKNETIYMPIGNNLFGNELYENSLGIKVIESTACYDLSSISMPLEKGALVIAPDMFANINPELVYIPLDTDKYDDIGLIYSKRRSKKISNVINMTKRYLKENGK